MLYNNLQDNFLCQHVNKPTRWKGTNEPSILDLIISADNTSIEDIEYQIHLGKSDHCVLLFKYICSIPKIKNTRTRKNYRKANYTEIRRTLESIEWEQILQHRDIDKIWKSFKKIVKEIEDEFVPTTKISNKNNKIPLNTETVKLIKEKSKLARKFIQSKDPEERKYYNRTRNKVTKLVRQARKRYEENLAHEAKSNPKRIWQYINSKSKTRQSIGDLCNDPTDPNSTKMESDEEKANILGTYELLYDVHFWIGEESTQDEYGTAAYKTLELDTLLDDKPVQHREVQGRESQLFKSYFNSIEIMRGGAETGFRHVKPTEYKPRLFHFCGTRKQVQVKEVSLTKQNLTSNDVFILDLGLQIYQWNGNDSNKDEKFKAVQYLQKIKSDKGGKSEVETFDERDISPSHDFFSHLSDDGKDEDQGSGEGEGEKELFQLSDASGSMSFNKVKEGSVTMDDFKSEDVFILDTKKSLFVWVGKGASRSEKQNAMTYAHKYLSEKPYPLVPVTCLGEGRINKDFNMAIAA